MEGAALNDGKTVRWGSDVWTPRLAATPLFSLQFSKCPGELGWGLKDESDTVPCLKELGT